LVRIRHFENIATQLAEMHEAKNTFMYGSTKHHLLTHLSGLILVV